MSGHGVAGVGPLASAGLFWLLVGILIGLPALPWHGRVDWSLSLSHSGWLEPALWANLWRSTWVHFEPQHRLMNLGACALLMAWGWRLRMPARAALAWALAWPLTHLALLADSRLSSYHGMSGALHAGVAVLAVHLLSQGRRWGWALLGGLLLKCLLENPGFQATLPHPVLDMQVAPLAHLLGSLIGAVLGLACLWTHRPARFPWQSRT